MPALATSKPEEVPLVETAAFALPIQAISTKKDAALAPLTPATPSKKERDMVWDNSKLILTVFVTTGHIIANFKGVSQACERSLPCEDLDVAFAFYSWFHMFEMPGFIFISGYFSRSFVKVKGEENITTRIHLQNNLTKIFFVWLTFSFFAFVLDSCDMVHKHYWLSRGKTTGMHIALNPFLDFRSAFYIAFPDGIANFRASDREYHVQHVAWYMFALFLWRLSVPYFKSFRRPILVAFITTYLSAFVDWDGQHLATRTFGYLPFFVVGLCVDPHVVAWLKMPRVQYACSAYLFGMFAVVYYNTPFFFQYVAKVPPDFNGWSDHWQCLFYYLWTLSMTFSFFAFVSMTPLSRAKHLEKNAQSTLYNYLLHYPIIIAVAWVWDWQSFLRDQPPWAQCVLSMVFALCIMVVTTTSLTIAVGDFNHKLNLFQWLISPRVEWLFEGSEAITLGNCMGDSSGYCTGHFGLGYAWSLVYKQTIGRLT